MESRTHHPASINFSPDSWRIRFLDEGAVAYHITTGHTHAIDIFTAEILLMLQTGTLFAELAVAFAQHHEIPMNDTLRQAISASYEKLQQLPQQ